MVRKEMLVEEFQDGGFTAWLSLMSEWDDFCCF